jgi:hypothetical protein
MHCLCVERRNKGIGHKKIYFKKNCCHILEDMFVRKYQTFPAVVIASALGAEDLGSRPTRVNVRF